MNNTANSCIIDYPGTPPRELTRATLSTRLRMLAIDPQNKMTNLVENGMRSDPMLDVTHAKFAQGDLSRYHMALLYLQSLDNEKHALLQSISGKVTHIVIVCDELTAEVAKLAVQFKVDDLLTLTDIQDTLYPALATIAEAVSKSVSIAPLTTIINGKAGSGASFITCCMSEVFASLSPDELALLDADFNYASLAHGLRLESRYSIDEAISELDKLDEAAIRSMMTDKENVHLLGSKPFSRLQQNRHSPQQLDNLCWKIRQTFDEVFIDMSKGLEFQTLPLLAQSSTILIVMQLSVACLRETKAMLNEMKQHVDLSTKQVAIVVNRYVAGKGEIQPEDVKSVLGIKDIFTISNNFELARLRTDLGKPLESLANHKVISKELHSIISFATELENTTAASKAGFFSRLLGSK